VFLWTTLGLSSLYFVVAGIQFWITQYLVEVLDVEYKDALGAFTVVSATGPVLGVVFGGWLVDYLGGYKGAVGVARTTKVILTLGFFAILMAVPACFVTNVSALMPLIWLLLFFGARRRDPPRQHNPLTPLLHRRRHRARGGRHHPVRRAALHQALLLLRFHGRVRVVHPNPYSRHLTC
jgi:MFS family permease